MIYTKLVYFGAMKGTLKHSITYLTILDHLFRLGKLSKVLPVYGNEFSGFKYIRTIGGKTAHRIKQDIVITDTGLYSNCTSAEWHLIGKISHELKEYNALWYYSQGDKRNDSVRRAINGLLNKQILIKTETAGIYIVNPFHIRRGEIFAVLATTASMLMDEPKVGIKHVIDKKPVNEMDLTFDVIGLPN